jgi:hypothetical protein
LIHNTSSARCLPLRTRVSNQYRLGGYRAWAADQPQSLSVIDTLARRVPPCRFSARRRLGAVGSRVAERPDMRDHLIAPAIPDWRGVRRSCPDLWLLAGEDVSHHVPCVLGCWPLVMAARRAARAGRRQDRFVPGGLILVRPHPGQRPCDASRSTAPITPAAGNRQHDPPARHPARRPRMRRTAMPHGRLGRSLVRRWLAARAHACQEARRSSPERTSPANAGSRSARTGTARHPDPPGTPRRSRARTDHTSHTSARRLPVRCRARGAWPAAPDWLLTTSDLF